MRPGFEEVRCLYFYAAVVSYGGRNAMRPGFEEVRCLYFYVAVVS